MYPFNSKAIAMPDRPSSLGDEDGISSDESDSDERNAPDTESSLPSDTCEPDLMPSDTCEPDLIQPSNAREPSGPDSIQPSNTREPDSIQPFNRCEDDVSGPPSSFTPEQLEIFNTRYENGYVLCGGVACVVHVCK